MKRLWPGRGLSFAVLLVGSWLVYQVISPSLLSMAAEMDAYRAMITTLYMPFTSVDHISAETLKAWEAKSPLLLDTRTQDEYAVSHLKDAQFLDFDSFNVSQMAKVPKDKTIVVYCSVGYRSSKVVEQLQKAGYSDVHNLYGGLFLWINEGHSLYRHDELVDQIHPYNSLWGRWISQGQVTQVPLDIVPQKTP